MPKRGDNYLCSLLIQAAKSVVMSAHKRSDPISLWGAALRERVGWQKAAVALTNQNAQSVGGDDQGRSIRPAASKRQAGCVDTDHRLASNEFIRSRQQARS